MIKARTLVVAVALIAAGTLAADAQGWGWGQGPGQGRGWTQGGSGGSPGYGRGPGWRQAGGPCVSGQGGPCWRIQSPEKHAACWKDADSKGLRAQARRSFMTECMTK
ncbi:PsiF family protein [Rhodoplanes roseus]|uniref:Uncharacterized protein n=1 Tax=Rhodoplanes roseus TaxID=29409 RepID=A0A327L658_9BRAD|nr:PsiF family protein [Rhodoplanes roseus]RAI43118.1 hypothetical protein CH341_15945 [Rhodoplanes roseus]